MSLRVRYFFRPTMCIMKPGLRPRVITTNLEPNKVFNTRCYKAQSFTYWRYLKNDDENYFFGTIFIKKMIKLDCFLLQTMKQCSPVVIHFICWHYLIKWYNDLWIRVVFPPYHKIAYPSLRSIMSALVYINFMLSVLINVHENVKLRKLI